MRRNSAEIQGYMNRISTQTQKLKICAADRYA